MGGSTVEREGNYAIQANQAKAHFLSYDQEKLRRKLNLRMDEGWLYTALFGVPYRIHRKTASVERCRDGRWQDANSFEEVMTLLDLICDSREDRRPSGEWKSMQSFGLQFHRSLLENGVDPWAELFAENPGGFARACMALGGRPLPQGDAAFAIEAFDGLRVGIQLWIGDEEFPSRLKIMWDSNALQYLRYETMYFAKALLLELLKENMTGG